MLGIEHRFDFTQRKRHQHIKQRLIFMTGVLSAIVFLTSFHMLAEVKKANKEDSPKALPLTTPAHIAVSSPVQAPINTNLTLVSISNDRVVLKDSEGRLRSYQMRDTFITGEKLIHVKGHTLILKKGSIIPIQASDLTHHYPPSTQ